MQEYGIQGFPTIKVFVPGKPPVDYQGQREVKPIAEFALQQVCYSSSVVQKESINSFSYTVMDLWHHNFIFKQIKTVLKERINGKSTGGSSEKSESASVQLNSRNFDELVLKSKELWIVEFFAPWWVSLKTLLILSFSLFFFGRLLCACVGRGRGRDGGGSMGGWA